MRFCHSFRSGIPLFRAGHLRVTHPFATNVLLHPSDLHVLGTPPAFILSQDQTLRYVFFIPSFKDMLSFFCSPESIWFVSSFLLLLNCQGSSRLRFPGATSYYMCFPFYVKDFFQHPKNSLRRIFLLVPVSLSSESFVEPSDPRPIP